MINVIDAIDETRLRLAEFRRHGFSIGFVPTMGALHAGHLSLIEMARSENNRVVVSIFVNPTQYDDPEDLECYPRTLAADTQRAESAGADLIFNPKAEDIYHDTIDFGSPKPVFPANSRAPTAKDTSTASSPWCSNCSISFRPTAPTSVRRTGSSSSSSAKWRRPTSTQPRSSPVPSSVNRTVLP